VRFRATAKLAVGVRVGLPKTSISDPLLDGGVMGKGLLGVRDGEVSTVKELFQWTAISAL